jgi:phospholipid transport system substrate-binding protein
MTYTSIRTVSRSLVIVLAVAATTGFATSAFAGAPTDQLRGQIDRVLKILQDPELMKENRTTDRRAAIRKVANDLFDFEEISRRTLGRHWQARSPEERREFAGLMTDLLEHAYIGRIETYSGEKVQFLGDSIDGDLATVRTKIVMKNGTEVPVDYRMINRGGRWVAYDVFIEGVSLVGNYRGQFDRIIQRQSYAELVKALRAKQAEDIQISDARRKERASSPPPKGASEPASPPARSRSQSP